MIARLVFVHVLSRKTDTFACHPSTVLVALPFAFIPWNPTPIVHMDIAGTVIGFVHAGGWAKPFATPPWPKVQAAHDWGSDICKWPGHIDYDQFVIVRGMKVTAGWGADVTPMIGGSLNAGYAFDRDGMVGTSILQYTDILNIPAGVICGAMLRAGF